MLTILNKNFKKINLIDKKTRLVEINHNPFNTTRLLFSDFNQF